MKQEVEQVVIKTVMNGLSKVLVIRRAREGECFSKPSYPVLHKSITHISSSATVYHKHCATYNSFFVPANVSKFHRNCNCIVMRMLK